MPPDPISDLLISYGINPIAFVGALILSCAFTAVIACAILRDDIPRKP
jgi:hypothetical protein